VLGFRELCGNALTGRTSSKQIRDALRLFHGCCGQVDSVESADCERRTRSDNHRAAGNDGERVSRELGPPLPASRIRLRSSAAHLVKSPLRTEAFHFGTIYD